MQVMLIFILSFFLFFVGISFESSAWELNAYKNLKGENWYTLNNNHTGNDTGIDKGRDKINDGLVYERENSFCFNCIGSRSPEIMDFYNNIGDGISSCLNHRLDDELVLDMFFYQSMTPLEFYYAQNPRKMTGEEVEAPFKSLCPIRNDNMKSVAVAFAFKDRRTHRVLSVPVVSCNGVIYPLKNSFNNCDIAVEEIKRSISFNKSEILANRNATSQLSDSNNASVVDYKMIRWNDYSESEYIECNEVNSSFCLDLCASETVCNFSSDVESNKRFIIEFGKRNYKSCDSKTFSNRNFLKYLRKSYQVFNVHDSYNSYERKTHLAFSANSLSLTFESPFDDSTNGNFEIIDDILSSFEGIFDRETEWEQPERNEFLFSIGYRNKINEKLKKLCTNARTPFILGMKSKPLLVVCRSDDFYEVRALIEDGKDDCISKEREIFEIIGE
ncbi:MAG: hypothetical protein HQK49_11425 [Oligoflexia bacterium]|nr:hypothetical protein [Oligoflexia bacterium]